MTSTGEVTLKIMTCFQCSDGSQINILEEVGVKYFDFGLFLLNDDNGKQVSIIKENNRDIISINREIVQKWLAGNGRPVSWVTLISVLKDIKLGCLAKVIESATARHELFKMMQRLE